MERLINIGFCKVGEWAIVNKVISPQLFDLSNATNVLYAFVVDGVVVYVGKTIQTLKKRMYGYQKPGPTQNTNIKCSKLLSQLLEEGKNIDIYALPDNGLHHIGVFHLNLAAGLEDSVIEILKPKWNGSLK